MSDGTAAESGRTALRVAAAVVLVLLVAPFVVTGVPSVVGAEESFVVLSGSMNAEPEPIIQPGDVVIVDGVNPVTVEEQDIITFTTGGEEPVTHRVVNVTQQDGQVAFRTKGDANEDADPQLIRPDQVIGEVVFVIPLIGHVVNFANTTEGFVLLVLLPIGLLVLSEVWNLLAAAGGSSDEEEVDGGTEEFDRSPSADPRYAPGVEADVDDADADEGRPTVTLKRTQMKWVAVGLVPVATAAGYAAFRLQSAWAITILYASVGLLVLSVLLYWRMSWEASVTGDAPETTDRVDTGAQMQSASAPGHGEATRPTSVAAVRPVVEEGYRRDPVVTGRFADVDDVDSRVEVVVDSRQELVEMALQSESWVVHDTDVGAYFLLDGEMLFRYDDGDGAAATGSIASGSAANGTDADGAVSDWAGASGWSSLLAGEEAEVTGPETHTVRELISVLERVEAPAPESSGPVTTGGGPPPMWSEEEVTPAVRRVGAGDWEAVSQMTDLPYPSGAADRAATDGGMTRSPPLFVRVVDGLLGVPIRALELLGYVVIAPPMALYRLVRPSGRGNVSDPQSDEVKREG